MKWIKNTAIVGALVTLSAMSYWLINSPNFLLTKQTEEVVVQEYIPVVRDYHPLVLPEKSLLETEIDELASNQSKDFDTFFYEWYIEKGESIEKIQDSTFETINTKDLHCFVGDNNTHIFVTFEELEEAEQLGQEKIPDCYENDLKGLYDSTEGRDFLNLYIEYFIMVTTMAMSASHDYYDVYSQNMAAMYVPEFYGILKNWETNAKTEKEREQAEGNLELLRNYVEGGSQGNLELQIYISF